MPEVIFQHPTGSRCERDPSGPIVRVPGSAGVALDTELARVWEAAHSRSLPALADFLGKHVAAIALETAALRAGGLLWPPLPERTTTSSVAPCPTRSR